MERYKFEHQVVHEVIYSIIPFEQRRAMHLKLVEWIRATYAEKLDQYYPVLAFHTEAAEEYMQAAYYWGKVAVQSIENGTYRGAEEVIEHALALLAKLPESQKTLERQLNLILTQGSIRLATHGQSAETTGAVYRQAQEIAQRIDKELPQKATILFGLSVHYYMRGLIGRTYSLAQEAVEVGERLEIPQVMMQAHLMLANCAFWRGDFALQDQQVGQLLELYKENAEEKHLEHYAQNPKITALICHTWALAFRGYPRKARQQALSVTEQATEMQHSFSLGMAYQTRAFLKVFLHEPQEAKAAADQLTEVSERQGFPVFLMMAKAVRGWVLAQHGDSKEGIVLLSETITAWRRSQASLGLGMFYYMLGECYEAAEMWTEGLSMFDSVDQMFDTVEERVFQPGLWMLRGKFHRALGEGDAAVQWFDQAYTAAKAQDNYVFGMYAVAELATLLVEKGENARAGEILRNAIDPGRSAVNMPQLDTLISVISNSPQ